MFSAKPFKSASLKDSTQMWIYIIELVVFSEASDDEVMIWVTSADHHTRKFHKEHFHLLNFPDLPEM